MGSIDPPAEQPDYVRINREHWTRANARYTDSSAEAAWAQDEIDWGLWDTPERDVSVLPDVASRDVIELGCGTAYFSAWLRRRGARRVVGVDVTPAQLDTARRLDQKWGLGLELIEANAESVPLPDASFDLVVSEYGASLWCDPYKWIPEAARLLRVGGELVFLRDSTLSMLCLPDDGRVADRLQRPQRGLCRLDWTDEDPAVEFHPGHGDLLRLLRRSGFEVIDLVEIFASEQSTDHAFYSYVTADWARRWPSEEIWRARRGGVRGVQAGGGLA
jgi:SAM-dependent methyltransferase